MATHQHPEGSGAATSAPEPSDFPALSFLQGRADATIVAQFQLLTACIILARYLLDVDSQGPAIRPLFLVFAVYSLAAFLLFRQTITPRAERASLLLAVLWISLMVYASGGAGSPFYPFYVFNVMIAAFRFGKRDGNLLTLAATLLFAAACLAAPTPADLPRLGMRAAFLLALGALIARLGEANLRRHRRLALLRDINCFANPRFGIDRTVADVMARCRVHFGASVCLLVARRARSRRYELRIAGGGATATLHVLPPAAPRRGRPVGPGRQRRSGSDRRPVRGAQLHQRAAGVPGRQRAHHYLRRRQAGPFRARRRPVPGAGGGPGAAGH